MQWLGLWASTVGGTGLIPGQATKGFPGGSVVKNLPAMQATQETWVQSLGQKIPWRMKQQPTLVFLPQKSQGERILGGL